MIQILKRLNYKPGNYNLKLLFYVALVNIVGLMIVRSATMNVETDMGLTIFQKQLIGVIGGVVIMGIVSLIDYHQLIKLGPIWYVLSLAVLSYLKFIYPRDINGAKRWIVIKGLGTVQPSEFTKIVLILVFAGLMARFQKRISDIRILLLIALLALPQLVLILVEPDLSTTMSCAFAVVVMIFVAGISYKWVIGVMASIVPLAIMFLYMVYQPEQILLKKLLAPHQVNRINGFFFPEEYSAYVYQQMNSVMAIASGKLQGKGLYNASFDSVKNGNFLVEEQCDFIWAVVGEELGFVGSCGIILLIGLLIFQCLRIARYASDLEGRLIAVGVCGIFMFQTFVNIGVATLVLPNTGIPLPFISAGISSLLSSFIGIGLLLNVSLQRGDGDISRMEGNTGLIHSPDRGTKRKLFPFTD